MPQRRPPRPRRQSGAREKCDGLRGQFFLPLQHARLTTSRACKHAAQTFECKGRTVSGRAPVRPPGDAFSHQTLLNPSPCSEPEPGVKRREQAELTGGTAPHTLAARLARTTPRRVARARCKDCCCPP